MNIAKIAAVCALVTLTVGLGVSTESRGAPASIADPSPDQIKGKAYRLERAYLVTVHVPSAIVDKVLQSVVAAVGLEYGKYDQVAYIDAQGLEQFRPISGSKAGAQSRAGRAPTKVVSFSLVHDAAVLKNALDAIYQAHNYEEPVVYVSEVWRTRSSNPDEANPNRWWNQKPK
jgi:hypothetical protein